jgi:ornithine cyclodeaminase/alanine dehydrogenase-like protein (mu-crystallin family)
MTARPRSVQEPGDRSSPSAPRYVGASELDAAISFPVAVDALQQAFAGPRDGALEQVQRTVTPISEDDDGVLAEVLLMPAFGPEGTGVKIVTIARENPGRDLPLIQGAYVLFSPDDLSPELLIDAAALTSLRTASVSALATRHLARQDSRELVVFGAGAQAEAHIRAMLAVRPIERVTVVATSPASPRARDLVARMANDGIEIATGAAEDVSSADIVCTCTTSATPVFEGELLPGGAHVNAVGAYRPDMCELDPRLLARASVTVETLEAAEAEAGDVLMAIAAGALPREHFAHELADVVSGRAGRRGDDDVTVFKSVGLAVEDLVIARAVADQLAGVEQR